MPKAINDPLLLIGKIFCIFIQGAMAIGAVALVIAIPASCWRRVRSRPRSPRSFPPSIWISPHG